MRSGVTRLDVICWYAVTVYSTTATVIALCLPELIKEFGLQYSISGTIESTRTTGVCVAFIILGFYAAGFAKKHILWSGYLLLSLGLFGLSLATGATTLMVGAFVIGFASGITSGTINALMFDIHPENPSPYLGYTLSCFPMGLIVASFLFGYMLEQGLDWRLVPVASGILNLFAAFLLALPRFPESLDQKSSNILSFFATMLRLPIFWLYGVAIFVAGGVEAFFVFWSRTYLDTYFVVSEQISTLSLAVFASTMWLGRVMANSLLRFMSLSNVMRFAAALGVIVGVMMPLIEQLWVFFVLLAIAGFSVSYLWQLILLEGAKNIPVQKIVCLSTLALCGMAGLVVYPLISGIIADMASFKAATLLLPVSFGLLFIYASFFKTNLTKT